MRRHHYRRRNKAVSELDTTTFLNLMVVLVPFLLVTAVFSRLAIVELTLPSSAGGASPAEPEFQVEVIVREEGLEITNGTSVIASLAKVDGTYDLPALSEHLMSLKRDHPDHDEASVLMEPHIAYDHLIQVMDVVRSGEIVDEETGDSASVPLFTAISVGDAP